MASRAILIGIIGDNKLFYLLDDREDGKNLGIVNASGSINYVDLMSFIMKNPKINEFKFSDFHRFIWDPQDGDEQDRWERIFVNKTQRVTKDMLVGATITNNFGAKPNKNAIQAKADLFRRMIRTSGSTDIHPLYLSRKSISPMRAVIGFKKLGASISIQPSVDGDGDGFIDDGLPTMRPFVAGFDIDISAYSNSSRSIQTQPSNSVEDRKKSSQHIISTIDEIVLAAATQFHDGKPIKTKRDAIRALTTAIPSFGNKSGSDKSRIDFLDKISDDNDELQPWHIEYISQFLMMVGNHPQRNSLMYEIKEIDGRQPPQIGGNTGPSYASRGWVPDPNGSGRYLPVDLRKGKLVVTYRSPDSTWERLKLIAMPISNPDSKNFNILSSSVDENVRSEMLDLVNTGKVPAMFYRYYGLLTQTSDQVRTYQDLLASGKQLHSAELQSIANFIISVRRAILDIETDIPGIKTQRLPLSPLDEFALITANPGVLMRALAELDNLSTDVLADSTIDRYKNLVDPILDKWGSVDTTITGVHEATHVLQMISINARNEKRASQFRQQFIADQTQKRMNEIRQTMGDTAARQQFARIRKEVELMAPPMESFLIDVLKDEVKSFALSDPELFKFRLLTYGMDQGILPNIQQGDGLDLFMPLVSQWLRMYVDGSVSILAPHMDRFFSQSFELDGQKILITPEISRLLKESIGPNIAKLPKFGSMDAGQPLTMGHITYMYQIMMDGEKLSHTSFRNINSETIKLNPATTTRELGIPDIKDGQKLIRGLTPEQSQPFVQAWIAAMPAIDRVMKKAKQGDAMAMLDSRQRPDRVVLPPEFGGLKYSELMALKPEQLADLAEKAIDGLLQRSIDLDRQSPQRRASFMLDLPRYYVGEFGPLTQAEIKQLVQISGKIGLPTGRAKDPAYSSYQAALLLNKMQLSPNAFMLFEFAAETGVAELFKIALSQVNISGIDTRSLTNDELQLLNKFFAFIYQAGFPSDIVGRFNG